MLSLFMVIFLGHFFGGVSRMQEAFQPFCFHYVFLCSSLKFSQKIHDFNAFSSTFILQTLGDDIVGK